MQPKFENCLQSNHKSASWGSSDSDFYSALLPIHLALSLCSISSPQSADTLLGRINKKWARIWGAFNLFPESPSRFVTPSFSILLFWKQQYRYWFEPVVSTEERGWNPNQSQSTEKISYGWDFYSTRSQLACLSVWFKLQTTKHDRSNKKWRRIWEDSNLTGKSSSNSVILLNRFWFQILESSALSEIWNSTNTQMHFWQKNAAETRNKLNPQRKLVLKEVERGDPIRSSGGYAGNLLAVLLLIHSDSFYTFAD